MLKRLLLTGSILGLLGGAAVWFSVLRGYQSRFAGPVTVENPLPAELVSELERYVQHTMRANDVPGVAMVLVHGDEVVYARGLGVKDLETREPVTTNTLMGIGSTTKSMTAVMIAALVDDGILTWDTPVTDIMPDFALSDPEISARVTIEHTLCMCTGVPRRMEEISVQYAELSAEDIIASLATIPLQGTFERRFNYSSRMLAAGGFIAAKAAGGEPSDLASAYAQVMQDRVLDPLEMNSSTFSIQQAAGSGDFATPYYTTLSGFHATPLDLEGVFTPIAPAGALWSNATDMSKYLIMLLNQGVAAGGRQVVSAENLAFLWKPRTTQAGTMSYGLGWYVEDYHGLTVLHHPGGTVGFASELVVIPELEVGFALLTNRVDLVAPVGRMATYRLLEMLTGGEPAYDQEIAALKRNIGGQVLALSAMTKQTVDPDSISPWLGRYHNDVLGAVELVLHSDNTLWLDVGEYEVSIRPLRLEADQFIFYESIFVGKTLVLGTASAERPTMTWTGDEGVTYQFVATVGNPDS